MERNAYFVNENKRLQSIFVHQHVIEMTPGARYSKVPKSFRTRKALTKSQTLSLELFYLYIRNMTRSPFIQEVSGVYTFLFLDTD